jgi:hypothetical protein
MRSAKRLGIVCWMLASIAAGAELSTLQVGTAQAQNAGIAAGAKLSTLRVRTAEDTCKDGERKCSGTSKFLTCAHNKWVEASCAAGTKCAPAGNSVVCH